MIQHKQIVTTVLMGLYDKRTIMKISQYIAPNFEFYVDNQIKDFSELLQRLHIQHQQHQAMKLEIKDIIAEDNKVATRHTLTVITKENQQTTWQGFAFFYLENNQITKCMELTRALAM